MNKQGIVKSISILFPTEWHSATKFGVNRICRIASLTGDGLVRALLKLDKARILKAIRTVKEYQEK
jgi:hypothetical protein